MNNDSLKIAAQPTAREQREYGDDALVHAQLHQYLKFKEHLHPMQNAIVLVMPFVLLLIIQSRLKLKYLSLGIKE